MARKFLFVFAGLVVLALAGRLAYTFWGERLLKVALVPGISFAAPPPRSAADYAGPRLWYEHGTSDHLPLPAGAAKEPGRSTERQAAIFFVHPTSFIDRSAWNAPDGDRASDELARDFLSVEANVFTGLGPLWAPRYRQAAFGAFLTDRPDAERALDAAYGDVAAAFEAFVAANPKGPIILAGHSQGSRHLMRLLAERVAGMPVAARIAAVYLVGWPVSVAADLPALGLPACTRPDQPNCILSWQSFAEPADTGYVTGPYAAGRGLTGKARAGTAMLCVDPLTGTGAPAPASANRGMTKRDEKAAPDAPAGGKVIVRPGVGARCDARGILLIDAAPDLGPYVLPGNNYHVYDYTLFWANVRADAARRLDAFLDRS